MIEISAQITNDYMLSPWTDQDKEDIRNYNPNQIVMVGVKGVRKPRSIAQMNTFWKICTLFAEAAADKNIQSWDHKNKIAFQCKVELQFIDASKTIVDQHGKVHLHYRSINFRELPHMEACNFFKRSYRFLDYSSNKLLGVRVDKYFEQIGLRYEP
jgi:hypothetical protein